MIRISFQSIVFLLLLVSFAHALPPDEQPDFTKDFDSNLFNNTDLNTEKLSSPQSSELDSLLDEAQALYATGHLIDARSKWQKAIALSPDDYRPYMFLSAYYLGEENLFKLGYQHIEKAVKLFEEKYGADQIVSKDPELWPQHAKLLYLLSEAELNLDMYQDSLNTLNRYSSFYWQDWFPGTKAWVLWKLKRNDEAIRTAQAGLLRGAEPGRTYNILGILLSSKGNRQLAIEAFAKAIYSEVLMGGMGQIATPLNNAGEVYSELFSDDLAEAAWIKSLNMRDGCEHILPSLNLAKLYIDELRLFQAERVLDDFEACFKAHALRADSEHRTLLALFRGRIALRMGEIEQARKLFTQAADERQWFGKIGTTAEDMKVATFESLSQYYSSQANLLKDKSTSSIIETAKNKAEQIASHLRSSWYAYRATDIAITSLNDLEDIFVRNTDSMIQYSTFGSVLAFLPASSLNRKIARISENDDRPHAKYFYDLYLGINAASNNDPTNAIKILEATRKKLRNVDNLAHAELLSNLIIAKKNNLGFWPSEESLVEIYKLSEALFKMLPSELRYYNLSLPILITTSGSSSYLNSIVDELTHSRFEQVSESKTYKSKYQILVRELNNSGGDFLQIRLSDRESKQILADEQGSVTSKKELTTLVNRFISKVFLHRNDPQTPPLPELEAFKGLI